MWTRMPSVVAVPLIALGLAGCHDSVSPSVPSSVAELAATQPPYTLTASASTVAPGGELSVSWTAPRGGSRDWVGLFRLGAAACDNGWAELTRGATSGTLTLSAPIEAGQYEFRYHRADSCDETARSSAVTVR